MGHRISALVLSVVTLMATSGASALGLGDITLKSNLNQRLLAEIELLEVRDLGNSEILVGLGSPADFERQGVERTYLLTDLQFDVEVNADGRALVVITTSRPVREPFLDFIIEARWPSGKLLREYTLLLDLPVFSDVTAAPVNPVQTETVQSSVRSSSSVRSGSNTASNYNPRSSYDAVPEPQKKSDSYSSVTPSYSEDNYRVNKNDTLWEIALSVRPSGQVSVHQTMMALHRANPEAFISGNINLLKSGQILRIPDSDEIIGLNQQQAIQDVARHNAEWTGSSNAAPLEASTTALSSYEEATDVEGRLSLSAPDDSFDVAQGRLSGGVDNSEVQAQVKALEAELAATSETLDKAESENSELLAKLKAMEEHVSTMESAIDLNNETAAALQLAEAERKQAEAAASELEETEVELEEISDPLSMGMSPDIDVEADLGEMELSDTAEAAIEAEVDIEAEVEIETGTDIEEMEVLEEEVLEEVLEEEVAEVVETPKPTQAPVSKAKPAPGILDLLMENILYVGLALIALLGAIAFFIIRQRDSSDDEFDDFLNDRGDFAESDDVVTFEEEDNDIVGLEDLVEDAVEESVEEPEEELDDSPEPQTEDVVAESDIYIAYGKYEQAEDMLRSALESDPGHHEARLKLLEIYAAQGHVESFDPHYAELRVSDASDNLIARAASLRESIAGAAAFEPSLFSTGLGEDDDLLDLDLDENLEIDGLETDLEETSIDLGLKETLEDGSGLQVSEDDTVLKFDGLDSDLTRLDESSFELDIEDSNETDDLSFDLEGLDFGDEEDSTTVLIEEPVVEADFDAADLDLGELEIDSGLDLETIESSEKKPEGVADDLSLEDEFELGSNDAELDIDFELGDLEETGTAEDAGDITLTREGLKSADQDLGALDLDTIELDIEPELVDETDLDLLGEPKTEDTESLDDVSLTGTSFDLSDLDEELEALTSDLGDSDESFDSVLELDDLDDMLAEPAGKLEAVVPTVAEVDDVEETDFDFGDLESLSESLDEPDSKDADIEKVAEVSLDEPETEFNFDFDDDITEVSPDSNKDSLGFELPEIDPESADDEDLDFLSDSDETATKLDLAAAYIDMGDTAGAKEIIEEIMKEGTETQKSEAKELLAKIGS